MFCPTCRSTLSERALLDANLKGYACSKGDRFYTTLIDQAGGMPTADTIEPPPLKDDLQILKFWLTDTAARARVPNQLAVACRRIVEMAERHHHVARVEEPFAFCPKCGETLSRFDSDDQYMQGLRCTSGHEYWWRGSTLHYVEGGIRANLSAELDDEFLRKVIEYYAGGNEYVEPYVHPQLRAVLKRFRAE
jgi:hypothetical protein